MKTAPSKTKDVTSSYFCFIVCDILRLKMWLRKEKKTPNAVLKLQTPKVGQLKMLILFAAGFHFIPFLTKEQFKPKTPK